MLGMVFTRFVPKSTMLKVAVTGRPPIATHARSVSISIPHLGMMWRRAASCVSIEGRRQNVRYAHGGWKETNCRGDRFAHARAISVGDFPDNNIARLNTEPLVASM